MKKSTSRCFFCLRQRTRILSLDLQFGRKKADIYSVDQSRILERWTQGRLYLIGNHYVDGLGKLSELSLFSHLPVKMILQYSIGRLIANRNLYELLRREHVISDSYNQRTYEHIRTLAEIVDQDKAGMIFSPKVGLHENVAVLDFNDDFNNATTQHRSQLGILPKIVKELLDRRIHHPNRF